MEQVEIKCIQNRKRARLLIALFAILSIVTFGGVVLGIESTLHYGSLSLVVVATASMLLPGIKLSHRAWKSRSWPVVDGVFLTYSIQQEEFNYLGHVFYTYQVGAKQYIGHHIWIGEYRSSQLGDLLRNVNRYTHLEKIKVYYDPVSPEKAILEPGFNRFIWGHLVISSFGLMLLWLFSMTP